MTVWPTWPDQGLAIIPVSPCVLQLLLMSKGSLSQHNVSHRSMSCSKVKSKLAVCASLLNATEVAYTYNGVQGLDM